MTSRPKISASSRCGQPERMKLRAPISTYSPSAAATMPGSPTSMAAAPERTLFTPIQRVSVSQGEPPSWSSFMRRWPSLSEWLR